MIQPSKTMDLAHRYAATSHPKLAISRLSSGKILLVTIDGRQAGESIGLSLTTLAELLLEFGAIVSHEPRRGRLHHHSVHNKIVNRPSDQTGERPVSDGDPRISEGKLEKTMVDASDCMC